MVTLKARLLWHTDLYKRYHYKPWYGYLLHNHQKDPYITNDIVIRHAPRWNPKEPYLCPHCRMNSGRLRKEDVSLVCFNCGWEDATFFDERINAGIAFSKTHPLSYQQEAWNEESLTYPYINKAIAMLEKREKWNKEHGLESKRKWREKQREKGLPVT